MPVATTFSILNGVISISQSDKVYSDSRTWLLTNGEYLNISDDMKIIKTNTDGIESFSAVIDTASSTYITIAINETESIAYVIYRKKNDNHILIHIKLSDMSIIAEYVIGGGNVHPYRAILSQSGKIILGYKNSIQSVNPDGSDHQAIRFSRDSQTFIINSSNEIFVRVMNNTNDLIKITFKDNGTLRQESATTPSDVYDQWTDSFIFGGYLYALSGNHKYRKSKIYKIPMSTWNDNSTYEIANVFSLYDVPNETLCNFSTDGITDSVTGKTYGRFYESGAGRMITWQIDLDTLICVPLRWSLDSVPVPVFSDDTALSYVFSNMKRTANNCDPSGFLRKNAIT